MTLSFLSFTEILLKKQKKKIFFSFCCFCHLLLQESSLTFHFSFSVIFQVPLEVRVKCYFEGVDKFCREKRPNCQLKEIHFVDINPSQCKVIKDYFAKQLNKIPMENAENNFYQNIPNENELKDT